MALASLLNILAQCWGSLIKELEAQLRAQDLGLGQSRSWSNGVDAKGQRSKLSFDALVFMKRICVGLSRGWEKRKNRLLFQKQTKKTSNNTTLLAALLSTGKTKDL